MNHLGLFEGIGGFSLAARWAGYDTVAWVEIDPDCQKILTKNFPHATGFSDIRQFDGTPYEGRIDLLTGGFPCQPFSIAGKRKGNDDERALWFEMYRVIREVKPLVVVAENVGGILTIENGLVFERVCTDLESEGYEVQPFVIPACAVGAPHRRDRVWIVAKNTVGDGRQNLGHQEGATLREFGDVGTGNGKRICNESLTTDPNCLQCGEKSGRMGETNRISEIHRSEYGAFGESCGTFSSNMQNATDTNCDERQFLRGQKPQPAHERNCDDTTRSEFIGRQWEQNWYEVAAELCRVDDGLPAGLDKNRTQRLKALGNAIVPQVAYQILKALQI